MFIHKLCGAEVRQVQNNHYYGEFMGGYTENFKECSRCRCILQQHEYVLAPPVDYTTMTGTAVWEHMVNNFLGREKW